MTFAKPWLIYLFLFAQLFGETTQPYPIPSYPYRHFGVDDGLPQSIVTNIIEDSYGFIWVVTNEGIARFNGTEFEIFNESTNYPFRLVTGVVEIKPGVLWVATFSNGLWELSPDILRKLDFRHSNSKFWIHSINTTPDSTILVCTEPGGVYELNANGQILLHISDSTRELQGIPLTAIKDRFGNVWVGTFKDGLQVFYQHKKVLHLTVKDGLPSNEIRSLFLDNKAKIWIGTNIGLWIQDAPEFTHHFNQVFNNPFISNLFSKDGKHIWVSLATGKGGVVHLNQKRIIEVVHPQKGLFVRAAYISRNNTLFLGTYRGLFVISNRNFTNFGTESGFESPYIRAITRTPDGTLLVGTRGDGLYFYADHRFERMGQLDPIFKEQSIFALFATDKEIWVGTSRGLVVIKNNKIQNRHPLSQFFKEKSIRKIIRIDQTIYFVTKDSLFAYHPTSPFQFPRVINHNIQDPKISFWGIARDKQGHLCAITNGQGLFVLKDTTWQRIQTTYPINKILGIQSDKQGILYLATSRGVFTWDGETVASFLPTSFTIWDLLPTPEGIWLLTSKGLLNYRDGKLANFNRTRGLITTEFNMGAVFAENDSSYWFGGIDGLVHYRKRVEYPNIVPPFYITALSAGDKTFYFPQSYLAIPFDNNNLSFKFTWITFGNYYDILPGYYLEGFDEDTTFIASQKVINYTNLPAGKYRFHLFLTNALTQKIIAEKTFSFNVLSPWWQTPWFRGILVLSAFLIFYIGVRWRSSYHQKRAAVLQEMVAQRTKEIELSKQDLEKEIEERRKIQASLDKERQLLAVTLKSIHDGVITTSLNGQVLLMNHAAETLTGVRFTPGTSVQLSEVLPLIDEESNKSVQLPEDLPSIQHQFPGKNYFTAILNRDKNPSLPGESTAIVTVAVSWAEIHDDKEEKQGYVWIIRDISLERQLEDEIIKTQKLESIGILAGGIAHDFNNILTGIIGNAQLAQFKLQMHDTDIYSYLEGIVTATENASRLTQQLLTFAKGGEPIKEVISLKEIIEETIDFALRGSKIESRLNIASNLWKARADKGQITQVLNNLIINAIQAMPEGGKLTVTATNITKTDNIADIQALFDLAGENFIKIEVIDTGKGIPREHLSKIFDPYFTTKKGGTGLGLATSYSIIKKHGGKITVDSEIGEGTCFTIYLPATTEEMAINAETKTQLFNAKGMRALIMDDEKSIQEIVSNFLEIMGFKVTSTSSGEEAIQKYKEAYQAQKPFDVCIFDLTVRGGMGGIEAARKIFEINPEAIVIVSSGYSTDSALANYKDFGFAGRITKPLSLEKLNQILSNIFRQKMAY